MKFKQFILTYLFAHTNCDVVFACPWDYFSDCQKQNILKIGVL